MNCGRGRKECFGLNRVNNGEWVENVVKGKQKREDQKGKFI